eukprot:CAMPEP_0197496352 /NCGR_PEP_ID=MMETSP1311-20131121/43772_1 /TAXON_ID=464262 /ORGANISM="Genus nov. species nov., Strain RCC856" /LENGTH=121 /DNA_ID=CAMNT_0043041923 /DNA_START=289 /DNA_END=651 /DNA_ORIENTATION=+
MEALIALSTAVASPISASLVAFVVTARSSGAASVVGVAVAAGVVVGRLHRGPEARAHSLRALHLQEDRSDLRICEVAPGLSRILNHGLEGVHQSLLLQRGVRGEAPSQPAPARVLVHPMTL